MNPDVDSFPEYVTFNGNMRSPTSSGYYDGIASSSALDAAAGNGAQKILIEGINDDGDLVSEVVVPTGTSTASFTNDYWVINTCAVIEAGLTGGNVGTLTLKSGLASLTAGEGGKAALHNLGAAGYPRGFTPLLQNVQVQVSRDSASAVGGDINIDLVHVQNMEGDVVVNILRTFKFPFSTIDTGTQTAEERTLVPPHIIGGPIQGTDFTNVPTSGYFYFACRSDAAVSAIVNCRADLLYRDVRA